MDDKDFVFINRPLSDKQEKKFSDFLKSGNAKAKAKKANANKKVKILET